MKKFELTKKTSDVYAFCALLLATSGILVYTDVYNKPSGNSLQADVYLQATLVDSLSLEEDALYAYKQESGEGEYDYVYSKYLVVDETNRDFDMLLEATGDYAPYVFASDTALFYKGSLETYEVVVEIEDGKIRIEKEDSPHHYCKIQGWVGEAGMPIICAPNYFMVVIEEVVSA